MGKQRQYLLDGASIKSVSPWDVDSMTGWTLLGGQPDPTGIDLLAARVPWLYRGIKDRANNVAIVPWCIERGEDEIANSTEWAEDKPKDLEWLDNPRRLMAQIEKSLAVAGKAYIRIAVNPSGYIKRAAYCAPQTIVEEYNKITGDLIYYKRTVNAQTVICGRADMAPVKGQEQIVAIYDPDYTTEVGPGLWSDALAALTAAGVLYSYDQFVKGFFERGAIKASVLTVESASPGEQERLQHWWDDVIAGVKNAFSAVVLRGKLNAPVVIGSGMEDTNNDSLVTTRRQDISTAMGVPESRLWSSAANYATRKEDELAYFRGTIIPDCDLIAEAFNAQIFNAWHKLDGLRMEFKPEELDIFQEDEAERAAALGQLTAAGIPLAMAMELLGYDLTDEQWAEIRAKDEEPEPAPVIVQPAQDAQPEQPDEPDEDDQPAPMTADQEASVRAMLKNWKRKALHTLKLTKRADVPWTTDLLPAPVVEGISLSLAACETDTQVKAVFDAVEITPAQVVTAPVVETKSEADPRLTDELKRATDTLERILAMPVIARPIERKAEPRIVQQAQPINVTVNMAEQKAPEVKVDVAAQPAPIVNVTMPDAPPPVVNVQVNPTPVTVQNTIECESKPQSARVVRDANGKITGLEAQ